MGAAITRASRRMAASPSSWASCSRAGCRPATCTRTRSWQRYTACPRHAIRRSAVSRRPLRGLLALADWPAAHGCTHVAMEARGVYWKPIWARARGRFHVDPRQRPAHPQRPRKTDVSDAAWIADLLAHVLIRGSFVPPARIQALRDLTRTRKQLWAKSPSMPAHSKGHRKTPTSRSPVSCPTSSARAAARCSPRSSRARPLPSAWPPLAWEPHAVRNVPVLVNF